jgi:thioredoxin-related protein
VVVLFGRGVTAPPLSHETTIKESTDRLIQRVAVLAMLVIVAFTAYRVLNAKVKAGTPEPAYAIGERIDLPVQLVTAAKYNLLVFARSTCGACQASKPMIKRMVTEVPGRRPHVAALLLAVEGMKPSELALADELGISKQNVRTYDKLAETKLRAVPTIMVVNHGERGRWRPGDRRGDVHAAA